MGDLKRQAIRPIDLSKANQACDDLVADVLAKGADAQAWYAERKSGKRFGALLMRGGGLLLAIVAPVLSVGATLLPKELEGIVNMQKVATASALFLTAAAGTVVLDKFFGWSSGWMRYARTLLDLHARDEEFQLKWQVERSKLPATGALTSDSLKPALELVQGYLQDIHDLVRKETEQWISEFGQSLGEAERFVQSQKVQRIAETTGTLAVEIVDFEYLDEGKFQLLVGDGDEQTFRSRKAVVQRLEPGVVRVRASGSFAGVARNEEAPAMIESGKLVQLSLSLRSSPTRGLLELSLPQFDQLDAHVFQLKIGDAAALQKSSSPAVIDGLEPGTTRIEITGMLKGKQVRGEATAQIEAGKSCSRSITLS